MRARMGQLMRYLSPPLPELVWASGSHSHVALRWATMSGGHESYSKRYPGGGGAGGFPGPHPFGQQLFGLPARGAPCRTLSSEMGLFSPFLAPASIIRHILLPTHLSTSAHNRAINCDASQHPLHTQSTSEHFRHRYCCPRGDYIIPFWRISSNAVKES